MKPNKYEREIFLMAADLVGNPAVDVVFHSDEDPELFALYALRFAESGEDVYSPLWNAYVDNASRQKPKNRGQAHTLFLVLGSPES